MMCRTSRKLSQRRGAAIVEMALVLPIFLMVTMGIIEFGRGLWVGNMVTNASREAARMAILDGSTNSQVSQSAKEFLAASLSVGASDVSVGIAITPATGNPNPNNECANASARDVIQVTIAIPFNKVSLVPGKYLDGLSLTGRSSMRHE